MEVVMPRTLRFLLVFAVLLAGCNGPLPFLSAGALDGTVTPPPARWADWGEDYGVVQLETNPADPYSVNIAYTTVGNGLYANAGDTRTKWVEHMERDPRVRLRRGDAIYELRAERVTDEREIDAFAEAWTSQGFYHRDPRKLDALWLYRLERR
jgi:hypothetical protein